MYKNMLLNVENVLKGLEEGKLEQKELYGFLKALGGTDGTELLIGSTDGEIGYTCCDTLSLTEEREEYYDNMGSWYELARIDRGSGLSREDLLAELRGQIKESLSLLKRRQKEEEKRDRLSIIKGCYSDLSIGGLNAPDWGQRELVEECKCVPLGYHLQIMLDLEKERLFSGDLLTQNSWEEYKDSSVIPVCNFENRDYEGYGYSDDAILSEVIWGLEEACGNV